MRKTLYLALTLLFCVPSVFAHRYGPDRIRRHQSHEYRHGERLDLDVTYLQPWGHTVADGSGLHYYHLLMSAQQNIQPPMVTHEAKTIPPKYWGNYPLFYGGQVMNYEIVLSNKGRKTLKKLTVVAIQEVLNPDGEIGERVGTDAVRDWYIPVLKKGQSVTLTGSILIPSTGIGSGLDQTHIQVFKSRKWRDHDRDDDDRDDGKGPDQDERRECREHRHGRDHHRKKERLLLEDIQAGIWCPPPATPTL